MLLSNKPTYIYGLFDPRTTELRYIGKTVKQPKERLSNHISAARAVKKQRVARWIRGILLDGLLPELCLLETVLPNGDWQEAERFYIEYFRSIGANLVNQTQGGEGCSGFSHSDSMREWVTKRNSEPHFVANVIAGRKRFVEENPEAVRKQYADVSKRNSEDWFIEKVRAGRLAAFKKDPSIAKKISERATVRWADNDNRIAHSNKLKEVWTNPMLREKRSSSVTEWQAERRRAFNNCKKLAIEYNNVYSMPFDIPNKEGRSKTFWLETEQKLISELSPPIALAA